MIRRRQARPVGRKSNLARFRCQEQKRAWKSALEEYCGQFLELINADTPEEKIQKFLQSHPIFFLPFLPEMLMFKTPVLTRYRVDFALLTERGVLVLIELERPGLHLLKKDGGITAELQHALDQVRSWLQVFANHKGAALDAFNLKLHDVAKVKGIVIAGRSPQDKDQAMRLRCIVCHPGWDEAKTIAAIHSRPEDDGTATVNLKCDLQPSGRPGGLHRASGAD